MSVLEAKAFGRPVIGARIGGIPELIQPGTDGFLFEPGHADELAKAIQELLKADHSELSHYARQDVSRRFSTTAHLGALTRHYEDLGAGSHVLTAQPA